MSTSTKGSPGALRAARIICGKDQHVYLREGEYRGWTGPEVLAEIIDDETAASELLEACRNVLAYGDDSTDALLWSDVIANIKAVIRKAEGKR